MGKKSLNPLLRAEFRKSKVRMTSLNPLLRAEFHLRDTPKGQQPTEINDIVVIYKVNNQDLVLVAVNIGSHKKLFHGRYHKKR